MNAGGDEIAVRKMLNGMYDYERKLYAIYSSFAGMFPEHKAFWRDIAVEENTHSMMVDVFLSLYNDGDISFSRRSFRFADIEAELAKLHSFQDEMKFREIPLKQAVDFSLAAEKSLVEREVFKIKEDDPPEFKKLLQELLKGYNKHYAAIYKFSREINR